MSDTDWLALATIGAALIGFIAAVVSNRRERRAIRDLHEKMGNGFAEEVTTTLGEILGSLDVLKLQVGVVRRRMDAHIKQHNGFDAATASNRKR